IGTLLTQLRGTAKSGKRHEWLINPGMSPEEIVGFGLWYQDSYERVPPTTAETLYERILEFRDSAEHALALTVGAQHLERLLKPDEPEEDATPTMTAEQIAELEAAMQTLLEGD